MHVLSTSLLTVALVALAGCEKPPTWGELVNGKIPGRTSEMEITLFRSLGLAVFDVAAAEYVVGKAHAASVGVTVEF